MPSNDYAEELGAMEEAKALIQSKPKEAPELLEQIIAKYKSAGKTTLALETRRWQCFGLFSNLDFDGAKQRLQLLISEAKEANVRRYIGIAKMYEGVVSFESGQTEESLEYFGQAIQIATELQDLDLLGRVQTNIAYALMTQERCEEALETLKNCVATIDERKDSVSNSTNFYNIAATTLQLAFRERLDGIEIHDRLVEAKSALQVSSKYCDTDPILSIIMKVQSALYTGLAGNPAGGLDDLNDLKAEISVGPASLQTTYGIVKCQVLELAGKWTELCSETEALLESLRASKSLVYCNSILRQASRAYAQVGNFEKALNMLQQSISQRSRGSRPASDDRTQFSSLQQDLEQQKFDQNVLRMRNKTLIERNKILEQEARYDPLSTLLNRRGTEEAMQQFTERKFTDSFLIVMLDIDHFKKINDNFGHAIGDQVIHEFAQCLTNSKTNPAKLGRWGGEEFLMVYDVSDPLEMNAIGATLVNEIRNLRWDNIHSDLKVTASCGLAMWHRGDSLDNAIRIADDMMYDVKHHGRNNWRVWVDDEAA
ncbi:MAG: tetratricopeptide repeat-containing diguanylate cyclase [Armatimonadota bacterium]